MLVTARREARRSIAWITCIMLTLVAAGCSGADDSGTSDDTTTSSAAPSKPTIVCNGADEVNEDDDGAVPALLNGGQLPPGRWTTAETPPCPWALSADELLAVPECRAAATSAGAAPNDESRNGNARVTFSQAGHIQLDDRIEVYTSRRNVDSIRAILAGPGLAGCYTAALEQRATEAESATTVSDVSVSRFTVQPDAAALGLSFPAVAGYAADPGFAEGVDITFTRTSKGESIPVAMRVITFGGGGLMSTLTLTGSPEEVDAIDLTPTLRAAAASYLTMVSPDR
jgi:hypothetical protein